MANSGLHLVGWWTAAEKEAEQLQVSAEPEGEDVARIVDAKRVQAGWKERMEKERADKERATVLAAKSKAVEPKDAASKCAHLATQESVIDVDEVEDVVAPVAERASSKAVSTSVGSSGIKVSVQQLV